MAVKRWVARTLAVMQSSTIVVGGGTWVAGEKITLTIGTRDLVLTVGSTVTTTSLATALKEMINGDTATTNATRSETGDNVPEFSEIIATVNSSTVTLTGRSDSYKGTPFTLASTTDSIAGTVTDATPTAATGPNFYNNADNWDTGVVPGAADDAVVADTDVSILYGLSNAGATLTSFTVYNSFTGTIGLPKHNSNGYVEYRTDYLVIDCTTITIGDEVGAGSGRIKINSGTVQTTLNLRNSGEALDEGIEAVVWKGTHASNAVNVNGGSLGIGIYGEAATVATLKEQTDGGNLLPSSVRCGTLVTLTTITLHSGTLQIESNCTTINQNGGNSIIVNGAFTTINLFGGALVYNSSGTIATLAMGPGTAISFGRNVRARTITNVVTMHVGSSFQDPGGTVTLSAGFTTVRCGIEEVAVNFGKNRTYTVA